MDEEDQEGTAGELRMLVVDVGTGDEIVELGRTRGSCASDGDVVLACPIRDNERASRQASFQVDGRVARISAEPLGLESEELVGILGDTAFASDRYTNPGHMVDSAGNVLDDNPGFFLAASGDYAIFATGEQPEQIPRQYTVHRASSP